jgi:hypothetical protein
MTRQVLVGMLLATGLALDVGGAASAGAGSRARGSRVPGAAMTPAPVARVAFRSIHGMVIVPVRVNGSRELNMILDTGMSAPIVLLMHRDLGDELRLEDGQPVQIGGAGGQAPPEGRLYAGATIAFGGIEQSEQTVIVMDEARDTSAWMQDGVIGKSIFDRYVVDLDFEHSVLSLYEPGSFRAQGFESIPVMLASGIPTVEAKVGNEGGEEVAVRLVIDLGAGHALSLQPETRHLVLPAKTITSVLGKGVQGAVEGRIGRIPDLRLGPFTLPSIVSSFASEKAGTTCAGQGTGADGNLGNQVLRRFRVVFDYAHRRILLSPRPGHDRPFEYNMAGLFLRPQRDGALSVDGVMDGSPAAEASIATGDRILAIDGQVVDCTRQEDLPDRFKQEGATLRLTMERAGTRFERSITLRRMI